MIGQRWHVYPTGEKRALERHSQDGPFDTVKLPQPDCVLCRLRWCEQRIEHGYPDVVMHAIRFAGVA